MLRNNVRRAIEFDYFSINFDGSKWIAWYRFPAEIRLPTDNEEAQNASRSE